METGIWILWVGAAVLAVAIVAGAGWWIARQRRRTEHLTERFGPEYRRVVEEAGDRAAAERELEDRERRVTGTEIRPLDDEARERYARSWREVQARFVDDPSGAIATADRLVQQVMEARGYPTGDFEQRVADISVDHADLVDEYRVAHDIAERHASLPRGADTEELRQAMVHYRALFEELLEVTESVPAGATR